MAWLRHSVAKLEHRLSRGSVCAAFALLRLFSAQLTVSHAVRDFSSSAGLTDWARPAPYILIAATLAFAAAIAGLVLFRLRSLHRSVVWAASAIVLLVLLAMTHSLSLYWPIVFLQTAVGPLTVSRIIEALHQPMAVEGRELFIGASIGVAVYPPLEGDIDTLMNRADQAMYSAKRAGKGRLHYAETASC